MQSGLIDKVAITLANTTNAKGLLHVCLSQGATYADKTYSVAFAKQAAAKHGCHLTAIKKNNRKGKSKEKYA